jgi:poly [ADP-ribose] polymerase
VDVLDMFDDAFASGEGTLQTHGAGVFNMIFNVDTMRSTLLEMNIDTNKLPLDSLSKERLLCGCAVLSEIANLIEQGGESPKDARARMKLIDGSSKFYSIIPHNLGLRVTPIIDTAASIQHHMKTMRTLLDMEMTFERKGREILESDIILQEEIGRCLHKVCLEFFEVIFCSNVL